MNVYWGVGSINTDDSLGTVMFKDRGEMSGGLTLTHEPELVVNAFPYEYSDDGHESFTPAVTDATVRPVGGVEL
eukprot:2670939-Pyramimonas_sp.AAC.1